MAAPPAPFDMRRYELTGGHGTVTVISRRDGSRWVAVSEYLFSPTPSLPLPRRARAASPLTPSPPFDRTIRAHLSASSPTAAP
jgi:hypothetical protein